MLKFARVGVAVSNAVPFLKKRADHITRGGANDGIVELIDMILRDELVPFKRVAIQ
jgi:hydroxymethylpyrimidine pyrophosphatase-like HAD family hydrolase